MVLVVLLRLDCLLLFVLLLVRVWGRWIPRGCILRLVQPRVAVLLTHPDAIAAQALTPSWLTEAITEDVSR